MIKNKKLYLAIPYTGLAEKSFEIANKVAAKLIDEGYIVFSPITHSHPLCDLVKGENTWDFWKIQDLPFIDWCDRVLVIAVGEDGYDLIDKSTGVQGEIAYAREIGKDIEYYEYSE